MHPEPAPRGPLLLDTDAFAGWGSTDASAARFEIPVFGHPPLRAPYERLAGTHPELGAAVGSERRGRRVRERRAADDAALLLGEETQRLIRRRHGRRPRRVPSRPRSDPVSRSGGRRRSAVSQAPLDAMQPPAAHREDHARAVRPPTSARRRC